MNHRSLPRINDFQRSCENLLTKELAKAGRRLANRTVEYGEFGFIHSHIFGSTYEVWIYRDEAALGDGTQNMQWEAEDFDSPQDLIDNFVNQVVDQFR